MNALRVRKDLETREIVLEREVGASRDRVWASWTTAADLEAWWGPAGWTTTIRSLDVRPGGLWHFGMGPVGSAPEVWIRAVYSEVINGSSLSYVEGFSDETGADLDPESNGETLPPDPAREVDDIEALIDANGGTAFLFGSSSGAVLALDAASRLGRKVAGLFMYEPPFIVDDSRPPLPSDLPARIADLVDRDRRSEAVTAFYREAMGIPAPFVTAMRLFMPGWKQAKRIAHTLRYDFGTMAGTQDGRPLPAGRWKGLRAPSKVLVGSKSEPFFHSGARALADTAPGVVYESLEGGHHGSAVMSPSGIADSIAAFFRR